MAHMGKESKKEWVDVHVQLNHFAVHLKLTQHCKSTRLQEKFFKRAGVGQGATFTSDDAPARRSIGNDVSRSRS